MNPIRTICALVGLLWLLGAFAGSAMAQARPATLNGSQEPGSVIVFPKFITGTVTVDGTVTPKTEFEIGVVCPKGQLCPEGQQVRILFHYACGSSEASFASSFVCAQTDFALTTTMNGKLVFNTEGIGGLPGNAISPQPQCARGYM